MGHSWGGMLAMSFASAFPHRVKSLLLLNSGPFKLDASLNDIYYHNKESRLTKREKEEREPYLQKIRNGTASQDEKRVYEKWELIPVLYDRSKVDSLIKKINRGGNNPEMGSLIFQSLFKDGFDLTSRLSYFKKPVNIITGAQDPAAFVSYEIKLIMPQSKLFWINKAAHFPMYEEPEQFYAALNKIIKQLSKNPNPVPLKK